jgi:alkylation response protein AidB-like acyl-CoA dehydrogenase
VKKLGLTRLKSELIRRFLMLNWRSVGQILFATTSEELNHIGRFVADAEAIYSYEGTREMNTLIVGNSITGLSAFV